ncbi:MAG: serine/threonine-protein kinase [bacterium]
MQFCNQCGGPIEGNPAQCPTCGTARGGVATDAPDSTAVFDLPPAADSYAAPPPANGYGAPAADPPTNRFDPYTGQPIADPAPPSYGGGFDPSANLEDTGAMGAPIPPPAYAAPEPAYAPPPQPAYAPPPPPPQVVVPPPHVDQNPQAEFHPAAEGQDTRPEIHEIIARILGERYKFHGEIGAGGMSIVYRLYDNILQTDVAVKVLYPELAINPEVANRFKNEAVITAKLTGNPHIIKVYDYGYKERVHYIITQYLSGKSLRDEMKDRFSRNEKFDWREASEIMVAVGKALESVHQKNVVHRDIKPGNIIVENGKPVLIDFGIAKIPQEQQGREWLVTTQAGMSLGTPHYISPEEAQGLGSNPKSDMYSLGVMFYEMVTGRVPFDGESAQQIMIDHVTKEPDDPTLYNSALPAHVAQIILKMLRKDPQQRIGATELVQHLEAELGINSRGSSASAEAVSTGGNRGGGNSGGSRASGGNSGGGATVIGKGVIKGKPMPGAKPQSSPVLIVVIVLALIGVGWAGWPMLFPPPPAPKGADPNALVVDPNDPAAVKTQKMDELYDKSLEKIAEGDYDGGLEDLDTVYKWNSKWRSVTPAYEAVRDFTEGKKAYQSGRNRETFENAKRDFEKSNQTWTKSFGRPFPKAGDYAEASSHQSDAIGAEEEAKKAKAEIPDDPKKAPDRMRAAYWAAQKTYERVTELLPWEAGAYYSRLSILIEYWLWTLDVKDTVNQQKCEDAMLTTIDTAKEGLHDQKEFLAKLYTNFIYKIQRSVFQDDEAAQEALEEGERLQREYDQERADKVNELATTPEAPATTTPPASGTGAPAGGAAPPAGGTH